MFFQVTVRENVVVCCMKISGFGVDCDVESFEMIINHSVGPVVTSVKMSEVQIVD